MTQSDTLSRQLDHFPDIDDINDDIIMLPDDLFVNLIDFDVGKTLKTLLEQGLNTLTKELEDWKVEDINGKTVLYFKGRNYIPKDLQL